MTSTELLNEDPPEATPTRAASPGGGAFVVDLICVVMALAAFVLILSDSSTWVRPPLVLIFVLFVPGWTIMRMFGAPPSVLGSIGAIGLSIVLILLLGESLVLFGDWKWFPLGLVLTACCCVVGTRTMMQRYRMPVGLRRQPRTTTAVAGTVAGVTLATVIAGNLIVTVGIRHTKNSGFGALGLVGVMSPLFWIGVATLIGGLVFACYKHSRWAWLSVAALVAALHGLPGLLEPNPRFSVSYLHVGFIDHIATHGTLLRVLDARFSWAGFFSAGGLIQQWTGTDSLLWVVRYAPLFYNGLAVILVALLAKRLGATEMQVVASAALFCCLNWIGQDYFSPQATAFLLYMLVITVVLHAFPADPSRAKRWIVRIARPARDTHQGLHGRDAELVLAGCYVLVVALVITHQLTPGFLLSATLLLVAVNAIRLRALPVFIAVVFLAWLSFGGDAYWVGHFEHLTGSVGKVGDLVSENVGKRTGSPLPARRIVLASRVGLALFSWGLATISVVIQWRRRRTPVTLVCLLAAPFPMLILQPYGGEMALRVCYFTLPAACILIAQLVLPARRVSLKRWIAGGAVLLALTPMFVAARFGNESFEAFSNDDIGLARTIFDVVPDGSTVFVAYQQTVVYWRRADEVRFRQLPTGTAAEVTEALTKKYQRSNHVYVALSESQEAYGTISVGRPADWMQVLNRDLQLTGQYRIVAHLGAGILLELQPS